MTSFKRQPSIVTCRELCDRLGARAVLVVAMYDDAQVKGASYGETPAECLEAGQVLDAVVNAGDLPGPMARLGAVIAAQVARTRARSVAK